MYGNNDGLQFQDFSSNYAQVRWCTASAYEKGIMLIRRHRLSTHTVALVCSRPRPSHMDLLTRRAADTQVPQHTAAGATKVWVSTSTLVHIKRTLDN